MIRIVGALIILLSIALMAFATPQVQFYSKTRVERLKSLWEHDIKRLTKQKDFADFSKNIKTVEITFPDPQVAAELDKLVPPFTEKESGTLKLKIQIIRWIDQNRYGYILQHDVFDMEEDIEEKIFEFGRTYKVGIFW